MRTSRNAGVCSISKWSQSIFLSIFEPGCAGRVENSVRTFQEMIGGQTGQLYTYYYHTHTEIILMEYCRRHTITTEIILMEYCRRITIIYSYTMHAHVLALWFRRNFVTRGGQATPLLMGDGQTSKIGGGGINEGLPIGGVQQGSYHTRSVNVPKNKYK